MTRVLIRHAATSIAAIVSATFVLILLLFGTREAAGVAISGGIAAADFIAIIYLTTRLLEPTAESKSKVGIAFLLLGKLSFVLALLWWAVEIVGISVVGVAAGIGSAILGFTWGLSRGAASPEGQAAIEAEERRIREQMERESPPPENDRGP